MFGDYRIICVTPAGRQRYLSILAPEIISSSFVDEYHLWKANVNSADVRYIHGLRDSFPKVRVIEPPIYQPGPNSSLSQFYRHCVDEDAIYIRFDDDIVFLEKDFFPKFLQFRVEHPEFFLVFPNTINNPVSTYLVNLHGTINLGTEVEPGPIDRAPWSTPHFAEQLHRVFLRSVATGRISDWYFATTMLALVKSPMNCVGWFGRDFADFRGEVPVDDEEWLCIARPSELMRPNCILGDAIVSHFAFSHQRNYLDNADVLDNYVHINDRNSPDTKEKSFTADTDLWIPRLLRAIEDLRHAPTDTLKNPEYIAQQIKLAGLVFEYRDIYGEDSTHMNGGSAGLWQIPMQLARCLVELSKYQISTVIEIGTWSGWTITFMTAYLARFNKDIQVTTVDVGSGFQVYSSVKHLLPITFHLGTASDFNGRVFDLAFIDGDHSYECCLADYRAVGWAASICMFHDICDKFVLQYKPNDGSVPRLWSEIKSKKSRSDQIFEYLDHSTSERIMGIGLIVRKSAQRSIHPHKPKPLSIPNILCTIKHVASQLLRRKTLRKKVFHCRTEYTDAGYAVPPRWSNHLGL